MDIIHIAIQHLFVCSGMVRILVQEPKLGSAEKAAKGLWPKTTEDISQRGPCEREVRQLCLGKQTGDGHQWESELSWELIIKALQLGTSLTTMDVGWGIVERTSPAQCWKSVKLHQCHPKECVSRIDNSVTSRSLAISPSCKSGLCSQWRLCPLPSELLIKAAWHLRFTNSCSSCESTLTRCAPCSLHSRSAESQVRRWLKYL